MSISYCAECGKEGSDHAAACPHCATQLQATSTQPPPVVAVKKNSHPILTVIGGVAIVVVILLVVLGWLASSAKSTKIVATDILTDENCTQLTDYCIDVNCTFQNQGNAAGTSRVRAQLLDKASRTVLAYPYSDITLLPNATPRVAFGYPHTTHL